MRVVGRSWAVRLYVLAVVVLASAGFVTDSPGPLLAAAALTLPVSLVAVPSYYVAYGLLALVPGANPSSASGSGSVGADGHPIVEVVSGGPAGWFTAATAVLGVAALTFAALINVVALQRLSRMRRLAASPEG